MSAFHEELASQWPSLTRDIRLDVCPVLDENEQEGEQSREKGMNRRTKINWPDELVF